MEPAKKPFWSLPVSELFRELGTGPEGLTGPDAGGRLERYGLNVLKATRRSDNLHLLLGQVRSPIILILVFAPALSYFLHDRPDALIILTILLISALLGFWQERGAANAVAKLLAMVLVVRSRRPFYRSLPSRYRLVATHSVIGTTIALPYTPLGAAFGLPALPVSYLAALGVVVVLYVVVADIAKRFFYRLVRA